MEKQEKKIKKRRKGKSILMIPESQKRKEPKRKDGSTYVVPKGERKIFHLEVEEKQFDNKTGKKQSVPHIVKLDGLKSYSQFMKANKNLSLEIEMLHDPRPYYGMTKGDIKEFDKNL